MEKVSIENLVRRREDIINWLEGETEDIINIIKRLQIGQGIVVETISAEMKNTKRFDKYLDKLRVYGLDVNKGDAEYGFKMPLPKKYDSYRELIIFRRR